MLRRDLWKLFHEIADAGAAVFVSSHVMDEADRCDRLLLMREGVIIADDTPDRIREKTRTDDIESAFLALVEQTETSDEPPDHLRRRGPRADPDPARPPHGSPCCSCCPAC